MPQSKPLTFPAGRAILQANAGLSFAHPVDAIDQAIEHWRKTVLRKTWDQLLIERVEYEEQQDAKRGD